MSKLLINDRKTELIFKIEEYETEDLLYNSRDEGDYVEGMNHINFKSEDLGTRIGSTINISGVDYHIVDFQIYVGGDGPPHSFLDLHILVSKNRLGYMGVDKAK